MDQIKFVEDSLSDMVCLSRPYHFKFFKSCISQILLGPFLNTLTQIPGQPLHTKNHLRNILDRITASSNLIDFS